MSDTRIPAADPGEPDMMAAELALGVLDGEERAQAIRRVLAEPGFAAAVEQWRARLAQLFDLWPAMETRDIFPRILRTLDAPVAALAVAPRAGASRLWPALAALSSIAAAILLVVLVTRPVPTPRAPVVRPTIVMAAPTPSPVAPPTAVAVAPTPTPAPVLDSGAILVAAIDPGPQGTMVTAIYDPRGGMLRLTEATLAEPDGVAQLWVIAGDGVPHSIGLLRAHGTTHFVVTPANRARLAAGAVLAVSLEPFGGSPTGAPTGPVVAKGALSQV